MPSAEVLSDNYGCGAGGAFCVPLSLLRARDTCSRSFLNLHTLLDRRAPCRRNTIESKGLRDASRIESPVVAAEPFLRGARLRPLSMCNAQ